MKFTTKIHVQKDPLPALSRSNGRGMIALFALIVAFVGSVARAQDPAFEKQIDINPIRYMSLQHTQTIKTFDTYAREALFQITGKSSMKGQSAAYVILDMVLDPKPYLDRNLIYIRNKPFRTEFVQLPHIEAAEKERIVKEGTISLALLLQSQAALDEMMAHNNIKAKAIREIQTQAMTLVEILDYPKFRGTFFSQAIIPPLESGGTNQKPWQSLPDASMKVLQQPEGVTSEYAGKLEKMIGAVQSLSRGWASKDAATVNQAANDLGQATETVNASIYPSSAKRHFEVLYNSLSRLTWPGAALYFVAFVMFLIAWQTQVRWTYIAAWIMVLGGWAVHVAAIAIRWWLVQKNIGSWFEAIPIKNQFESVMFSAWFGTVVALVLEAGLVSIIFKKLFKIEGTKLSGQGIFGAAGAGIGMLSLIALFVVPYVMGTDIIGAGIKQNAGILMTYWLYIHVTLVTASYALIGMTFIIGVWYTIQHFANSSSAILQTLDQANLVMLQLAFWILGIGIMTGALWADVSWGRPWGWDPKETFALITWIVYLIIVHIRFVTAGSNRALVTSILSVIGFFVMLFNWVGVNFFLVGLHSYA